MDETKDLVKKITEGIQEKKGRNIVIADLTNIEDNICKYFVICQGNSPSQVLAIVDSVKNTSERQPVIKYTEWMVCVMHNGLQWTTEMYWYMSFYLK